MLLASKIDEFLPLFAGGAETKESWLAYLSWAMVILYDVSFMVHLVLKLDNPSIMIQLVLRQGPSENILRACSGLVLLAARIILPHDKNVNGDNSKSESQSGAEGSIKEAGGYMPWIQTFWPLMPLLWPKDLLWEKRFAVFAFAVNICGTVLKSCSPYLFFELLRLADIPENVRNIMGALFIFNGAKLAVLYLSTDMRLLFWQIFQFKRDSLAKEYIFMRIMRFSAKVHKDNKPNVLAERCDSVTLITRLLDSVIFEGLSQIIQLVHATIAIALMYGLHTAMVLLATVIFGFIVRSPMMRLVMRMFGEQQKAAEATRKLRHGLLEYWKTILVNNKIPDAVKRLFSSQEKERSLSLTTHISTFVCRLADGIVGLCGEMLSAYLALVFNPYNDKKKILLFIEFSKQIVSSTNFFIGFYEGLLSDLRAADGLRKLIQTSETIAYGTEKLGSFDHVEFRNVSLLYDGKMKKALSDFSFQCHKGEMIALVGPSGSGKSSTAETLVGVTPPTEGTILIGGQNTKDLAFGELTSHIAYQEQHPHIMDGTFAFNIGYGVSDATESEIQSAAREVGIDTAIEELPEKYNTESKSSEGTLSGGQEQRIVAARNLLRVKRGTGIVVLDEATSLLDPNAEEQVMNSFRKAGANCIMLVIAHRLKTVEKADKILVLANGHISESGTHEQLLEQRGEYFNMWNKYTGQGEIAQNGLCQDCGAAPTVSSRPPDPAHS
ncbi:unnamed protein product [Fusarium langsethiae]|nr:unnamed protein product [Fusarium langsethiae]